MRKSGESSKSGIEKGIHTIAMLRTGEACRLLNIHSNTLRRWSEHGMVKVYRVGPRGDRRFRQEDIVALLIERTKNYEADEIKLNRQ